MGAIVAIVTARAGALTGLVEGATDGIEVSASDGGKVSVIDGLEVGDFDGLEVGMMDGDADGATDGLEVVMGHVSTAQKGPLDEVGVVWSVHPDSAKMSVFVMDGIVSFH